MRLGLMTLVAITAFAMAGSVAADPPAQSANAYAPPPEQQLLDLERRLSATAQDHGLGGALGSVIDPHDGFVMRAGAMYQGQAAIEAGLNNGGGGPIFWQPDRVYVAQSGDMGMTSGRYVQVVQGAEAVQGRYIAVWRKDAGGQWRLLSETRQADPPHMAVAIHRAAPAPAHR